MSDESTPLDPKPIPKPIDPCGSPNGYHEASCPLATQKDPTSGPNR